MESIMPFQRVLQNDRMKIVLPIPYIVAALLATAAPRAQAQSEKEPKPKAPVTVVAHLFGKEIAADKNDALSGLIMGELFQRFAKENNITPMEKELDEFASGMEKSEKRQRAKIEADRVRLRKELENESLGDKDRKAKEKWLKNVETVLVSRSAGPYLTSEQERANRSSQREMGRIFVQRWKINRALFRKYGGRAIFQQAGPEPLDAYRKFLRDHERRGSFKIHDAAVAKSFWNYFVNEKMHVFVSGKQAEELINTPWWKMRPEADQR